MNRLEGLERAVDNATIFYPRVLFNNSCSPYNLSAVQTADALIGRTITMPGGLPVMSDEELASAARILSRAAHIDR
jgi:hypothetical protein